MAYGGLCGEGYALAGGVVRGGGCALGGGVVCGVALAGGGLRGKGDALPHGAVRRHGGARCRSARRRAVTLHGPGLPRGSWRRAPLRGSALPGSSLDGNARHRAARYGAGLSRSPRCRAPLRGSALPGSSLDGNARHRTTRHRPALSRSPRHQNPRHRSPRHRNLLRGSALPRNPRTGRGGRRRVGHRFGRLGRPGSAAASRGCLRRVRLRRGVVVGLVVRHGVVPAVVEQGIPGNGRPGYLGPCRGSRGSHGPGGPGGPGGPVGFRRLVGRPVRVGGRQREHLTRSRFLRGGTLVRGGQGAPPAPGRPGRVGRVRLAGLRGQRRGQRVLFPAVPPGTAPGRRGHALRRHGPAQPGVGGRGTAGVLAGHDDGALGDPGARSLGYARVGGLRVVLGAPAPTTGATGPLARRRLRGNRKRTRPPRLFRGALSLELSRTPPAPPGRRDALTLALGTGGPVGVRPRRAGRARDLALQERVDGHPPGTPPPAAGGRLLNGERVAHARGGVRAAVGPGGRGEGGSRDRGRGLGRDGPRPTADRHLQHVRAAAHARHLVRLQHATVRPDDPAHDRLVHRVASGVRPAYLDAYDRAALRRRHHDGVVQVSARRRHGRVAGGVDARHVRDEMRERGGQQPGVHLGLDGRRVDGELDPPRTDQLDGPVDTGGDDGVEHHLRTGDALRAVVEALVAEDVVDERGDAGVTGRQVVQHLVGLGPQLPGVVRGQCGQLLAQLLQGPAQGVAEEGEQLFVPGGDRLVPVLLPLTERGVAVGVRGGLLRVLLPQLLQLGHVLPAQRREFGGVFLGEPLQLLGVPLLRVLPLLGERVERPPVGEGQHGADELVAVAHGRGRQVDRHLVAALGEHHLPAHPVLAPGAQGVGERGLVVREGRAVGPRVQDEGVQLTAAEVAGPVAQDLGGGRVDEDDPPVGVGADDALGGGPQDHLGLPLRAGQFGLGVDGAGEVADDQHQQLVAGVAVAVVGLLAVLQVGAGDLDRELGPVGAPGDHPCRLGARPGVDVVGPPHGPGDEPRVELRQQVQQPASDQRGARGLEGLQRDGVRVDDGAVGVDQDQRVGQGVQYGCEASSASGWPAAHETLPSCYRTCRTPGPSCQPARSSVTRGSLRVGARPAGWDGAEVVRRSDAERVTGCSCAARGRRTRRATTAPPTPTRAAAAPCGPSGRSHSRRGGRTWCRRGVRPRCR